MMPFMKSLALELKSILYFKPVLVFLGRPINDWNQDPQRAMGRTIAPLLMGRARQGNRRKSSGKTGGKVTWVTETSVGGSKKQLCMRFQSGKCDMGAACRFHHGCAFPLPSGEACNKNHGGLMHDKTPH